MSMVSTLFNQLRIWWIIFVVILQSCHVTSVFCNVKDCQRCDVDVAICSTSDQNNLVPKELNPKTKSINITYIGTNIYLNDDQFKRFTALTTVTLSGNIGVLSHQAFANMPSLTDLAIEGSTLNQIEDDAFGSNSSLLRLSITDSQLELMPTNVFHSLVHVQELDLSYNSPMVVCSEEITSIGAEFVYLTALRRLSLKGLASNQHCGSIKPDYFKPITNITDLDLKQSGFLEAGPTILTCLDNLQKLTLSDVMPFKKCPRMAKDLFKNLPTSLVSLSALDWKTSDALNRSCIIDNETLDGLKNLPNLESLDFRYSEKIFGDAIGESLFHGGFKKLARLDLGWCSFNDIAPGAFKGLNLTLLFLNSNMMGSREFWPFGPDSKTLSSSVKNLDLSHIGIVANNYSSYYIMKTYPNLEELNLSNNMLVRLPHFDKPGHSLKKTNTKHLNLRENRITELAGHNMIEVCHLMPNLTGLNAYGNRISNVSNLCQSLMDLNLGDNMLSTNCEKNLLAIQLLRKLVTLRLSSNGIFNLIPNMFDNMMELQNLYLDGNELSHIDNNALRNNLNLQEFSLGSNRIETFDSSLLAQAEKLEKFWISDNNIEQFDSSFLDFVKRSRSLTFLEIKGNQFDCSCGNTEFRDWLNGTDLVHYAPGEGLKCKKPDSTKYVYNYTESYFKCNVSVPLTWTGIGIALIVITVIIANRCFKYQWYIKHCGVVLYAVKERTNDMKHSDECKYDALICCDKESDNDMNFAQGLLQQLEGGVFPAIDSPSEDERVSQVLNSSCFPVSTYLNDCP